MTEAFSATVNLCALQAALKPFEGYAKGVPVKVRLTIDDMCTLTIEPASPAPVTLKGEL